LLQAIIDEARRELDTRVASSLPYFRVIFSIQGKFAMRGALNQVFKLMLAVAAGTVCGQSANAAPRPPSDVACLLVSNLFAKHPTDAKQREKAIPVLSYYFGRVDAQLSGSELKKVLQAEGRMLKSTSAPTLMSDCAKNMVARQKIFNAMARQIGPAK
jgi:hypothetical protein